MLPFAADIFTEPEVSRDGLANRVETSGDVLLGPIYQRIFEIEQPVEEVLGYWLPCVALAFG